MAIMDGQLVLSNLANGDSPTAIADNASTNYIDQMVGGLQFFQPGGGAYIAPWIMVQVTTAFASAGSATIIAVLQDSPDTSTNPQSPNGPGTWTDRIVGPTYTVGGTPAPSVNTLLLAQRILPSHARYLRVVYRIATAVMTAGTALSFIMPDQDIIDIAMRKVGTYVTQTGQLMEAIAQGVLQQ